MSNTIAALGMMITDVVVLVCTALIIKLNIEKWNKKIRILVVSLGLSLIIVYVSCFFSQYKAWNNFNAALIRVVVPWALVLFCLCILVAFVTVKNFIIEKEKRKKPTLRKTLEGVAVTLLMLMTMFVCPFFEVFSGNTDEFSFSVSKVLLPMFLAIVISAGIVVYIYTLLDERAGRLFISLFWAVGVMSYVQGLFLNGHLFLMDGKDMDWPASLLLGNMAVWIVVCLLLTGFANLKKMSRVANEIIVFSAAFLVIIQLVGLISLIPNMVNNGKRELSEERNYLSDKGIREIASDSNVIVFVLDTYDVDFFEEVKAADDKFFEPLSDFVFYPDTISSFSRTYPSVPYMLSHKLYFYEEPKKEYVNTAFEECTFWSKIIENDYSVYIYEDDKLCIGDALLTNCENYCEEGHVLSEKDSFLGGLNAIITVGGYKSLPYLAKLSFSYTSESVNGMVIKEQIWDNAPYIMDDALMIKSLKDGNLTVSEDQKAFRFIHMMGAHAPYVLNARGETAENRIVEPVEQYQGCMQYVFRYIEELKRLGKYDDSMLIITADHGENFVESELLTNTNPILLIKYPDSCEDISFDEAPENGPAISYKHASLEDILPTIADTVKVDFESDGIGYNLQKDVDINRIRYHYFAVVENTKQTGTLKYEIKGSSRDFGSWKNTGEYHQYGEYYDKKENNE